MNDSVCLQFVDAYVATEFCMIFTLASQVELSRSCWKTRVWQCEARALRGKMSKMEEVFLGSHDMLSQEALLDALFNQMTRATSLMRKRSISQVNREKRSADGVGASKHAGRWLGRATRDEELGTTPEGGEDSSLFTGLGQRRLSQHRFPASPGPHT